jgi:hypothetical protein
MFFKIKISSHWALEIGPDPARAVFVSKQLSSLSDEPKSELIKILRLTLTNSNWFYYCLIVLLCRFRCGGRA